MAISLHGFILSDLAMPGPSFYLPAACAFFRALRVYPSPVEFIMMVQSTLPAPIFKVCTAVTFL